ncbi:hypothetical protein B9T33_13580 [Acinetobacter sp. ANC 5054]|uniref:hypothetical protein n=1 Tax=Acinetobacter sp. ANC 5054 TaxID=1977877 RepID=UPI000A34417D|nr:hypothetical protein [Acinetobacter sp. ANC 5054]OTG78990.1 hypothetical protein B9T33_13580 [Acinetobacter sp. ANC 5054]
MDNRILNGDFEFLSEVFENFFKQKYIRERLNAIEQNNITGWEIWLQVEFSFFLEEQENVMEWQREVACNLDKRIVKLKDKGIIDFWIREKNKSKETMIAVELKQASSAQSCITAMVKDLNKFNSLKPSEHSFIRSFWCVGVHRTVEESTCIAYINQNKQGYEFNQNHLFSKPIKGTKFSFTIL